MRFDAKIQATACRLTMRRCVLAPALVACCLVACTPASESLVQPAASRFGTDAEIAAVRDWLADSSQDNRQDNRVEPIAIKTAGNTSVPPVEHMIGGLEARLLSAPNDLKGWSLLAQAYAHVGRMREARDAVDRAVALGANRERLESRIHRARVGPT